MADEQIAKPASLPPYPEMILAAIAALNDKNGSNKSAISKHIEGKYGDLPKEHGALLTAHLVRMKESGQLLFLKNNYFRTDAPDAPPKRGRGRPRKPIDPNAPPKPASPRPRGRPVKPKDPEAEAANPPKKAKTAPAPARAVDGSTPGKRGRGRPPKARPAEPAAA
ncbi:hypothetical protein ACQJBY_051523 [Aegilops geniculata]